MAELCPKCGNENLANKPNCGVCGYTVKSSVRQKFTEDKTVMVGDEKQKVLACINCGYPVIDSRAACPNCNESVSSSSEENKLETEGVPRPSSVTEKILEPAVEPVPAETYSPESFSGPKTVIQKADQNTVSDQSPTQREHKFKLISVSIDSDQGGRDLHIYEKSEELGRHEIDKNDASISNSHVKIYEEDGSWYVENLASNRATFIVLDGRHKLENGDLILIGNSKFFKVEGL